MPITDAADTTMSTYKKVFIGVLTRARPTQLRRLLESILALDCSNAAVELVVVESEFHQAERIVKAIQEANVKLNKISYMWTPKFGIAPIRNEILRLALDSDSDLLTMFDDDTTVASDWLVEALHTFDIQPNANAITGRVLVDIEIKSHSLFFYCFSSQVTTCDISREIISCATGATNNFACCLKFLRGKELLFDSRLPYAGGTDSRFFRAINHLGGALYHNPKMIVTEHNTSDDYRISNVCRRSFLRASSVVAWEKLDHPRKPVFVFQMLKKLSASVARILKNSLTLLWRPRCSIFSFMKEASYFSGLIAGVFSSAPSEYKKERRVEE